MSRIGDRNLLRAKNRSCMAAKPALFQMLLQLEEEGITAAAMRKIYTQYYRQSDQKTRLVMLCTKGQKDVLASKLPGYVWRHQFSLDTQRDLPGIFSAWERMLFKLN